MTIRFIPFYYTDREFPEFKAMSEESQDALIKDLESYERAVCEAVEAAKAAYIDKHLNGPRGTIYSHTWGKGHHNIF